MINGRGQFNCSLAAQVSNTSLPMCTFKEDDQCAPQKLNVEPNKTYRIRLASSTALASLNLAVQVLIIYILILCFHYLSENSIITGKIKLQQKIIIHILFSVQSIKNMFSADILYIFHLFTKIVIGFRYRLQYLAISNPNLSLFPNWKPINMANWPTTNKSSNIVGVISSFRIIKCDKLITTLMNLEAKEIKKNGQS